MKKMRDYGFVEQSLFDGLAPKAREKYGVAVIGSELEVADMAKIWE